MLSTLWIKIALSLGVVALVAGGYWYVSSLQKRVEKLAEQNVLLERSNIELQETVQDTKNQLLIVQSVTDIGDKIREENRSTRDKRLIDIDKHVKEGKDRPVGPLLKEFLNGE